MTAWPFWVRSAATSAVLPKKVTFHQVVCFLSSKPVETPSEKSVIAFPSWVNGVFAEVADEGGGGVVGHGRFFR
jgi:hypothetical protein